MTQSYSNHRHRPRLFAAACVFITAAFVSLVIGAFGSATTQWTLLFLVCAVTCCALMNRRYTTRLQDRVIKLELRYRADRVLSPEDRAVFWSLKRPQLVALRFASDAELPSLTRRAAAEHLTSAQIKQAIRDWEADHDRT